MHRILSKRLTVVLASLILTACAAFNSDFESPTVTVSAFRVTPSNAINPKFEIDLHIINPNDSPLELRGVAYSATIEGHKILTGVANQLPVIAAYGEGDVSLIASADLFGSFRLLNDLMTQRPHGLKYKLELKLDVGAFIPAIRIEEQGEISLNPK